MLLKSISVVLLVATSTVLGCEMDCRRGLSKDFASFYSPVIKDTVNNLQSQLISSIQKVTVPTIITTDIDKTQITQGLEKSIETTLDSFVTMATADSKLAEGFYQVMFNEELPYKGDCNNPKRLNRKMPPPGESWTLEECKKKKKRFPQDKKSSLFYRC